MKKLMIATAIATMTTTGAFAQEEQLDELVDVELGEIGMDNVDVSALPDAAVAELHLYLTSDTQESESITQNRVRSVLEDYGVRLRTGEVYVVDPATTVAIEVPANQLRARVANRLDVTYEEDVDVSTLTDDQVAELYLILTSTDDATTKDDRIRGVLQ
ncbi:hypothetical protein [Tranquillimonas alkanivorans]|uniref:Uncharacterized protein n=1 Tax=Tranquillimonas alkanivorans TaxID=441119 RepID=A0A1I5M6S2_9RHOB|nr:hypothetical protein [Tranquillimonas alkanivorans]SFP05294.1 hypothetical protein SAMN04488047_102127 [Tranquillimonas alkanivorans]